MGIIGGGAKDYNGFKAALSAYSKVSLQEVVSRLDNAARLYKTEAGKPGAKGVNKSRLERLAIAADIAKNELQQDVGQLLFFDYDGMIGKIQEAYSGKGFEKATEPVIHNQLREILGSIHVPVRVGVNNFTYNLAIKKLDGKGFITYNTGRL